MFYQWMKAPKFVALFKSNVQVFESDGSIHKTTTIQLNENVQTEIKQMVKDEENQVINDIRIKAADSSLSSFVANQLVFTNAYILGRIFHSTYRSSGRC